MTVNDMDLLREFARTKSEEAFAAVVSRHVNLVYSVALRQARDPHLAQEITQTVFVILARKAASLGANTVLSGWLCQTARHASTKALTTQWRRQKREHQAYMQSTPDEVDSREAWADLEPALDGAMAELGRKDHDAIVLRFFEGRNFKDVGAALASSEAGAKMRVNRALEKLRAILAGRGITLSAALVAAAVSAHSVQAAPVGLASSATAAALNSAAVTSSTLSLVNSTLKLMAWTKMKTAAAIGAVALLAVGTTTVLSTRPAGPVEQAPSNEFSSFATPEATLKTMIAALNAADHEKFAAACTPEKPPVSESKTPPKPKPNSSRKPLAWPKP